jgi:glycosyltransferase involved in cell wall biosynthesis
MKDEEANLPRALASVPPGARVLAIDAESTDESVAIARAAGCDVVVRPWRGFVETRRFALSQVATAWTFMLDADEELDASLSASLAAAEPSEGTNGYAIRRTTYFCGRPMRYGAWASERLLRLFRPSVAYLVAKPAAGGTAEVHERWNVAGDTPELAGTLLHHSYPSLSAYRSKFARYTSIEASGLPPSVSALARAFACGALRAPYTFLVKSGWRDGWRGGYVAIGSAAYPVVVAWKALTNKDVVRP